MCREEEKMCDHILLHCIKARVLWQLIFALFNVQWVMHSSIRGRVSSKLVWFFYCKKKKKDLESCSIMRVLDLMEGEK